VRTRCAFDVQPDATPADDNMNGRANNMTSPWMKMRLNELTRKYTKRETPKA